MSLNEASMAQAERDLARLEASYEESRGQCRRLLQRLEEFEEAQLELDPLLIPLQRTVAQLGSTRDRLEEIMGAVQCLGEAHELAQREEAFIMAGPLAHGMGEYAEGLGRLQARRACLEAIPALAGFGLAKGRLITLLAQGQRLALARLQELLKAEKITAMEEDEGQEEVSEEAEEACRLLAELTPADDFERAYVTARQLEPIANLTAMDTARYVKHSHPLIGRLEALVRGMRGEQKLAAQLIPLGESLQMACLRGVLKPAGEGLLAVVGEGVVGRVKRACQKRQFADQVYLFDLIEIASDLHAGLTSASASLNGASLLADCLAPSVKALVAAGRDWLQELEQDAVQAVKNPTLYPAPPDATVLEQTSMVH